MRLAFGSYTGNGVNGRQITGVGFQPELVFVMGDNTTTFFATSSMPSGKTALVGGDALLTTRIQSLDADGFTLAADGNVAAGGGNPAKVYHWMAAKSTAGDVNFKVGSYSGNGNDNRSITGVGFQPDLVFVKGDATVLAAVRAVSTASGDISHNFYDSSNTTNLIQAFETDGFQVGNDNKVNASGTTYYYVAFKNRAGFFKTGTYSGNGADNRSITGVGFQPNLVWVFHNGNYYKMARPATTTGDNSGHLASLSLLGDDYIQALQSDGFQIGTKTEVNQSSQAFYYAAFKNGDSSATTTSTSSTSTSSTSTSTSTTTSTSSSTSTSSTSTSTSSTSTSTSTSSTVTSTSTSSTSTSSTSTSSTSTSSTSTSTSSTSTSTSTTLPYTPTNTYDLFGGTSLGKVIRYGKGNKDSEEGIPMEIITKPYYPKGVHLIKTFHRVVAKTSAQSGFSLYYRIYRENAVSDWIHGGELSKEITTINLPTAKSRGHGIQFKIIESGTGLTPKLESLTVLYSMEGQDVTK